MFGRLDGLFGFGDAADRYCSECLKAGRLETASLVTDEAQREEGWRYVCDKCDDLEEGHVRMFRNIVNRDALLALLVGCIAAEDGVRWRHAVEATIAGAIAARESHEAKMAVLREKEVAKQSEEPRK